MFEIIENGPSTQTQTQNRKKDENSSKKGEKRWRLRRDEYEREKKIRTNCNDFTTRSFTYLMPLRWKQTLFTNLFHR